MSEETPHNEERNPFTRPGFILSAALILILIAGVLVIVFMPQGGDDPEAGQPPAAAESNTSAPGTGAGTEESVCGLPSSGQTALGSAPESEWELVGTFAAPTAPERHGPGITDDNGIRSCFAHSPTGALYSAVNLWALGSVPANELEIAKQLTAPGPGRDTAIAAAKDTPSSNASDGGVSVQVAGFQVTYTKDRAVVDLAFRASTGALGSAVATLEWADGDWKGVVGNDGEPLQEPEQIRDLSEYIPWAGA